MNEDANEIVANRRLNNNKATTSKSLKYKTKLIEGTAAKTRVLNTKVNVPSKYLSNL